MQEDKLISGDFDVSKKGWKFEDLYIYKDFAGVEYMGKSYQVQDLEIYSYEWE